MKHTPDPRPIFIRVNERDNVAVVANSGGLPAGSMLEKNIRLAEDVEHGHKVALADIALGEPITRYGETIGYAVKPIRCGQRITESLIRLPAPPDLKTIPLTAGTPPSLPPLPGVTFEGYRNKDGSVGTKNVFAITTSVQCVAGVANHLADRITREILPRYPNVDSVVALNHSYGCGVAIDAPTAVIPIRTLQNIVCNPNFGNEVLVLGLGCEKLIPTRLVPNDYLAGFADQPSLPPVLTLQDQRYSGFEAMIADLMSVAEIHLERLNHRYRQTCPVSDLVVGLQCGGSDAFSGLTANPAVGYAADLLVRAGGSVMFSEVTEVRDAIHLLLPRTASTEVAAALLREMSWYDDYLSRGNADRSANPTPGNKAGGLANVVEKALGSIAKSGTSTIIDVIGPGARIRRRGLTFAATPASDFVCGTLQLAAGMNLQVFTTGRGTPYGLAMVPVIKVATNSDLARRWHDLMDLDAGTIVTGDATIATVGRQLFELILDVASGRKTVCADRLGLHNDLALFNPAPIT